MKRLVIEPEERGKGRTFRALPIAMVAADGLWDSGNSDVLRPVWMMAAASEDELRPFVANVRTGRKARVENEYGHPARYLRSEKVEFMRSAEYQYTWQRLPEASIVTAFLPDLFRLDPGMVDPAGIRFVMLPSAEWINAQDLDAMAAVRHVHALYPHLSEERLTELAPIAHLFAAFLDRRTRCPLVNDSRFYLQILIAALEAGSASFAREFSTWYRGDSEWGHGIPFFADGLESVGIRNAVACSASHETMDALLAEQARAYFERAN